MMSRIVGRSLANIYRNIRPFHETVTCMKKDDVIQSYVRDTSSEDGNYLTTVIDTTRNSSEFLNDISKDVKHFSAKETMGSLRTLFALQKDANTSVSQRDILQSSDFEKLCRSLKRNARQMELNDVIDALKIISFVGTKASSEVTMSLLNMIKYQINDVTLGHIIFLDSLLDRMESNPLVEALKMALPTLLQVQISTKLDHENVAQLIDLLRFVSRRRVSDPCIMNICTALILRGEDLSPDQGLNIVWSISSRTLRIQKTYLDKILEDAIRAISRRDITDGQDIPTISTTLKKMISKYLSDPHEFEKFYDETFFNKCADSVVANDLGFKNSAFIQRHFSDLSFVHVKMLRYMLQEAEKYPELITDCQPNNLITLVTALSQANFKPHNWDKIKALILRSSLLTKEKRLNLPWTKISLELLSIGIECPAIWDKVFSNQFIREQTAQDKNRRKLLILELYQMVGMTEYNVEGKLDEKFLVEAKELLQSTVQYPMQQYLELAFGGPSFVFTKVRTKLGQIINRVIAFDKKTMEPTQIDEGFSNDVFYEDIATDKSKLYIAVLSFPGTSYCINIPIMKATYELRLRTFEKMGINTVSINQEMWNELADVEKIPYIQREVRLKVEQVQNVLR